MRRVVGEASRLVLTGDVGQRGELASAHPAVVAEPIDIDVEADRRRRDFEADGVAFIDADVGRESLKRRVAGSGDIPFGARRSCLGVLTNDRIGPALSHEVFTSGLEDGQGGADQGQSGSKSAHTHICRRVFAGRCPRRKGKGDRGFWEWLTNSNVRAIRRRRWSRRTLARQVMQRRKMLGSKASACELLYERLSLPDRKQKSRSSVFHGFFLVRIATRRYRAAASAAARTPDLYLLLRA